jgi:hypothetical protein
MMSRKAILIRVLIFGPLFAYFGYGAYQKWRSERSAEADAATEKAAREAELKAATRSQPLPGGGSIDVVELTPEQAERLYGIKAAPEETRTTPGAATDAKAAPAPEAKAAPAD